VADLRQPAPQEFSCHDQRSPRVRLFPASVRHRRCGVGAEIAALVAEQAFGALKAPIRRVVTADVPVPFNPGQEAFIEPTQDKIEAAVRAVVR